MMIRVTLIDPADRRYLLARWIDPITGKSKYRSTGTTIRREAERFAARLETELDDANAQQTVRTTWKEFRNRYEAEVAPTKAKKTWLKTRTMFTTFERLVGAKFLHAIDGRVVSTFAAKLRESGVSTWTVRGYLSELRKTLRWANRLEMLAVVPAIEMPRAVSKSKGRPLTAEEFERFLGKIPEVVTNPDWVPEWDRLCWGLWLSGLRLEEAMRLHWTDDMQITPDFSGRRPYLRIPAAAQKSRQFQLLPMPPDFADHLQQVEERTGWIYTPWTVFRSSKTGQHRPTATHVGKVLCEIGKKSRIRVSEGKTASAHDFRRSFAARWARHLTPQALRELMRHASVTTTEQFYLGSMAEAAADELWRVAGHSFGHSQPSETTDTARRTSEDSGK